VRLTGAPGELRGAVLRVRRWRHFRGELVIECGTTDGAGTFIRAAWTDRPRLVDEPPTLDLVATGEAWRQLAHCRWPGCVRRAAQRSVKTEVVAMSGQLALVVGEGPVAPAAVWETLPLEARAELTMILARLVALMAQEQRDE
jgi:hypothetical protein